MGKTGRVSHRNKHHMTPRVVLKIERKLSRNEIRALDPFNTVEMEITDHRRLHKIWENKTWLEIIDEMVAIAKMNHYEIVEPGITKYY